MSRLGALLQATTIDDDEEMLEAANAALLANKSDEAAKHTKVVALLKLDRFDDALRLLDDGDGLQAACVVERAYALYKTGRLDEVDALLGSVGAEAPRSLQHLAAQVAYRAERFDQAEAVYRTLLASDPAGEESDLGINALAAAAQAQWQGRPEEVDAHSQALESFEACYNRACADVARGDLTQAAQLVQRAAMLCAHSDELSEEEKQVELRPIRAQQAYILARLGKTAEALEVYQSLSPSPDDEELAFIIENNLLALEPDGNPYLRQRRHDALRTAAAASKLFSHQAGIARKNGFVIGLAAHKLHGVSSRTKHMLGQAQHASVDAELNALSLLNAAAETHGLPPREALRKLQLLATSRPLDVGPVLAMAQLHVRQGHVGSALSVVEAFFTRLENDADNHAASSSSSSEALRFSPGLVALAVTLMRAQQREASAKAELVKAARHWLTRRADSAAPLLLGAGIELMRSSDREDLALAAAVLEKLVKRRGSDIASAGLVAALSADAAQHSSQLPPVEELINAVDVDALFANGVAAAVPTVVQSRKRPAEDTVVVATTKKRRRRRLPRDYVEGKLPDPERWLPLRDRSTYRPRGKKGKKRAADATQGGVVRDEETLGLVGGGGVRVEKAVNKKKKKGKGKK